VVRGASGHLLPTEVELNALGDVYHVTPLNLLPLVLLAVLSLREVPPVLALMTATLFAGLCGAVLQPDLVQHFGAGGGGPVLESIRAVLSRLAADSGTVTSALVPWNSCGAFMGAVLGVSTIPTPSPGPRWSRRWPRSPTSTTSRSCVGAR
jgi:Na+/H+ antiporter NhaC